MRMLRCHWLVRITVMNCGSCACHNHYEYPPTSFDRRASENDNDERRTTRTDGRSPKVSIKGLPILWATGYDRRPPSVVLEPTWATKFVFKLVSKSNKENTVRAYERPATSDEWRATATDRRSTDVSIACIPILRVTSDDRRPPFAVRRGKEVGGSRGSP